MLVKHPGIFRLLPISAPNHFVNVHAASIYVAILNYGYDIGIKVRKRHAYYMHAAQLGTYS